MTDLLLDAIRQAVRDTMREELANLTPLAPADSDLPEFLNAKEAAALLRLDPSTLSQMRQRGEGPPYQQYGRAIRYRRDAVLNYVA